MKQKGGLKSTLNEARNEGKGGFSYRTNNCVPWETMHLSQMGVTMKGYRAMNATEIRRLSELKKQMLPRKGNHVLVRVKEIETAFNARPAEEKANKS